jgi:ribonuclease HI
MKRKCSHLNKDRVGKDTLVLAIDGACSNNGKENTKMSVCVLWTRDPEAFERHYNVASTVQHSRQTNQIAELIACEYALLLVDMVFEVSCLHPQPLYGPLNRVVIKSDSAYVVRGVTEWMHKLTWNGYIESEGHRVVNEDLRQDIELAINSLEAGGLAVEFWQVPRD